MISDKLLVVIIVLGAFIALSVKEIIYFKERRDLYDRLTAKSFAEYKRESNKDNKEGENVVSSHRKIMRAWRGE